MLFARYLQYGRRKLGVRFNDVTNHVGDLLLFGLFCEMKANERISVKLIITIEIKAIN